MEINRENTATRLLEFISFNGEVSPLAIKLFDKTGTAIKEASKLKSVNEIHVDKKLICNCQWLKSVGKAPKKMIRLTRESLNILDYIFPGLNIYYLNLTYNYQFTNPKQTERRKKISEVSGILSHVGFLVSFDKPNLSSLLNGKNEINENDKLFYNSVELAHLDNQDSHAKRVGMLIINREVCLAYANNVDFLRWSNEREQRSIDEAKKLANVLPGDLYFGKRMFLFDRNTNNALKMLQDKNINTNWVKQNIAYNSLHFIPLNDYGINTLKVILLPNYYNHLSMHFRKMYELTGGASGTSIGNKLNVNGGYDYYYFVFDNNIMRLHYILKEIRNCKIQINRYYFLADDWLWDIIEQCIGGDQRVLLCD